MAGGELRRSYTQMDFSLNRVNIRPQMQFFHQQPSMQVRDPRRRFSAMPAQKVKQPTMEIYRPPSVRHEGQNGMATAQRSLNVHAPEFTMNKIQPSRSTSSVMMNGYGMMGAGPGPGYGGKGPMAPHGKGGPMMIPLQLSKSSGNVLHVLQPAATAAPPSSVQQVAPRAVHFQEPPAQHKGPGTGLKRSKSLSATDTMRGSSPGGGGGGGGGDLGVGVFTAEVQQDLHQAIKDPNEMSPRSLMTLANVIVERAISDRRYAEPAAKICINIIEKEKKETFLETLLNTCQLSYQERDKLLRNTATGSRYRQYMTFLNEMYVQLKRSQLQLKTHYDGVAPHKLFLTLLAKCFIDCLQAKSLNKVEIEAMFFILTSIGKDLEQNLPQMMEQIFYIMRDVFVFNNAGPLKNTLLQLIELRAHKWQLPSEAVMYYYPASR